MRILRPIIAVVVAYLVLTVLVVGMFAVMGYVLGADRLYEPGSFRTRAIVNMAAIVIGVIVSLAAGSICVRIARSQKPVLILAAIIAVLGVVQAIGNHNQPDPGPRPASMTFQDAVEHGKEPDWLAFLNPVIGVVGVIVGSKFAERQSGGQRQMPPAG